MTKPVTFASGRVGFSLMISIGNDQTYTHRGEANWVRLVPNRTNSGIFKIRFQYVLARKMCVHP